MQTKALILNTVSYGELVNHVFERIQETGTTQNGGEERDGIEREDKRRGRQERDGDGGKVGWEKERDGGGERRQGKMGGKERKGEGGA